MFVKKLHRFSVQESLSSFSKRSPVKCSHVQRVHTFRYQESLPRLPIPDLSQTCARYLRAQRPLLSSSDMSRTEKIVKAFQVEGAEMQQYLIELDQQNKHTSYTAEPWLDMYLKIRCPLILSNGSISNEKDARREYNELLIRSTNISIAAIRFAKLLRDGELEPTFVNSENLNDGLEKRPKLNQNLVPVDMSQTCNLFNTARIPKKVRDEVYCDPNNFSVTVMRNGHIFNVQVLDATGSIIDGGTFLSCLNYIRRMSETPAEIPVGALTTLERDEWADVRERLVKLGNASMLKDIEGSLFLLCLDGCEETRSSPSYVTVHRQHLLSDGTNRWFDKSFSLIINEDGDFGVNLEHSSLDGIAVLRFLDDINRDVQNNPAVHPGSEREKAPVNLSEIIKPINFILDEELRQKVLDSLKKHRSLAKNVNINVFEYERVNKDFAKERNFNPDCVIQTAFQLANYKTVGKNVGSYESCSTATFKHGRTETIRPCTIETNEFCRAMSQQGRASKAQLKEILYKCSKVHASLIKEAKAGMGFDRHLFALKSLYDERKMTHDIFKDPAYENINYCILSTSCLPLRKAITCNSFAPSVPDGFGIGYKNGYNGIRCTIIYYENKVDGELFIRYLREALDDICDVLQ